ncbi:MAG: arsenate reductase ArsC [Bacteroidales bacterium]|jgi:arsenate reductase|nr:arsenate reductase ArsC [Bacteroidales bacterium]
MKKILFVCIHNSARSQMAEAFVNNLPGDKYTAQSAGLEPGKLNPYIVKVMQEIGIDISKNPTNSVFEFHKEGRKYDCVVTVCDEANGERCPIFPGITERLHWGFADPSAIDDGEEETLKKARIIRDEIKAKIEEFFV